MENILRKEIVNNYDNGFNVGYRSGYNPKNRLMFVFVAKNNLKYFKDCKKAIVIDHFKAKMQYRYEERFKEIYSNCQSLKSINLKEFKGQD
jgi:hypothetical protein